MDVQRSVLVKLFEELAKTFKGIPDDEFSRIVKGDLRVAISFEEEPSSSTSKERVIDTISEGKMRGVQRKLVTASSREEGYRIISNEFVRKAELFAFAKHLDLPVQRNDKVDKIREKIVTYTVGRRLGGDAIRGDFGSD